MRPSRPLEAALCCGLLLLALVAVPARGAIEGSPHDLITQGYDVTKTSLLQDRCSRCHIPSSPAPQDFLPVVPPILSLAYGSSSLSCFSCHDGTTIVNPDVDASRTAFHPSSHGTNLTGYEGLRSEDVGLPYLTGGRMECTTCHDPHDNGHRPFLRTDLQELCLACHSQYTEFGRGKENRTGNHILGVDPVGFPRPAVPLKLADAFRTPYSPAYPLERGKGAGGWHWDLGGHLSKGGSGGIVCSTCHAVHGDEAASPTGNLLAVDPVNDLANEFCEGCHRGRRGDGKISGTAPNPGGTLTGRTYHPCDDDAANGEGRILEVTVPQDWPLGGGTPRRLLCSTCHRTHHAQAGTRILRPAVAAGSFCMQCHNPLRLDYHHPTGETQGNCGANLASSGNLKKEIGCEYCHQAHNAGLGALDERDFVPILSQSRRSDDLCTFCHTAGNPTCSATTTHLASHFLGDPSLTTTYEDKQPPVRVEPWPESGLESLFGDDDKKSIICMTCHRFRRGAVVSGDDGKSPYLVAKAGNPVEWVEGEEAKYLCTGCHGLQPGTGSGSKGHTHPLMKADILALGLPAQSPASATPAGHVNCDSCHRSHGAVTVGGVYIMEAATGANVDPKAIQPVIDFTPTCHLCHNVKKY